MNTRIPKAYTIITMIAIGAFFGMLFLRSDDLSSYILSGSKKIPVTAADTPVLRERGLSNSDNLPKGTGMLFIFDQEELAGFWMKDMNYPIDIVWIDQNMKVISSITAHPESYPEVFYPPQKIKYVLEINEGEANVYDLTPGQEIQFYKQ